MSPSQTTQARLLVIRGTSEGTIFPLYGRQVLIGRLASNDLPLEDDSVSRLHARLFFLDDRLHVEDLGSRWGTLVNGKPVAGHALVLPGDDIQFGDVLLRYEEKRK